MVQTGRQRCGSLGLAPHQAQVYQPLCLCLCWDEVPARIHASSQELEWRRELITYELAPAGSSRCFCGLSQTEQATYLWAFWPWSGLLPGLLGPPLLPEVLATATAGRRRPLGVCHPGTLALGGGALITDRQLHFRAGSKRGSLQGQPCKQQKVKLDTDQRIPHSCQDSCVLVEVDLQDEGCQADGGTVCPGWPTARGPVTENCSLQHPHFWGNQDVQCHSFQLRCTGMTQMPSTLWSASRWDATATRNATSSCSEVREFAIVPLHAAPLDAVAEMDALYDVYLDVRQKWDLEDVLLLGDFNAGCSYVAPSQWSSIRLRTSPAFQWLIPDTADTTATSTHCAYDRIVAAGTLLRRAVVPDSAAPFNFQAAFGLSDQLAQAISDHYPVEVTLKKA
ncbi:deoxyribonuclease-1 isoform X1 [Crocuta crocuta]